MQLAALTMTMSGQRRTVQTNETAGCLKRQKRNSAREATRTFAGAHGCRGNNLHGVNLHVRRRVAASTGLPHCASVSRSSSMRLIVHLHWL